MMNKSFLQSCIWVLLLSLIVPVRGGTRETELEPTVFRQEELDQMLAPIALYPDSLLIQVLMAATYPLEVVQAARWLKTYPNLRDQKLADALEKKSWDPSVKSLVNFPTVLSMMNDKLEWTQTIGDAFLGQKDQVMATIQDLRAKAQAQGNLYTTNEQIVDIEENAIMIEPASPEVIYVPTYNPTVVFGPWWYPAYPPFYYYPRGYAVGTTAAVISFGIGAACGAAWGYAWGGVRWRGYHVYVNPARNIAIYNNYYRQPLPVSAPGHPPAPGPHPKPLPGHPPVPAPGPGHPPPDQSPAKGSDPAHYNWQHNPTHRKGVTYNDPNVREQFGQTKKPDADVRKDFRGSDPGGMNRPTSPQKNDNLNRDGDQIRQQSERGRSSRESMPNQKPIQLPQGGNTHQGSGIPNPGIGMPKPGGSSGSTGGFPSRTAPSQSGGGSTGRGSVSPAQVTPPQSGVGTGNSGGLPPGPAPPQSGGGGRQK